VRLRPSCDVPAADPPLRRANGRATSPSMSHIERVARYYDTSTEPFYLRYWDRDHIHFGLFGDSRGRGDLKAALDRMTWAVARPAHISRADRVVDAGCGVGGTALTLARHTGCSVTGLTISRRQVALARRRARCTKTSRAVRFARADCSRSLPFADASVDVVVSIEAACHFPTKDRFIGECARVLRRGGRLVLSDWMASDDCRNEGFERYLEPVRRAWHLGALDTPRAWRALLRAAGLDVRQCVDLSRGIRGNIKLLQRATLTLMLAEAASEQRVAILDRWLEQIRSLVLAWEAGAFTVGRVFAMRP